MINKCWPTSLQYVPIFNLPGKKSNHVITEQLRVRRLQSRSDRASTVGLQLAMTRSPGISLKLPWVCSPISPNFILPNCPLFNSKMVKKSHVTAHQALGASSSTKPQLNFSVATKTLVLLSPTGAPLIILAMPLCYSSSALPQSEPPWFLGTQKGPHPLMTLATAVSLR